MMKLTPLQLRILDQSRYLTTADAADRYCELCGSDLAPGQLVYAEAFGDAHLPCLIPGLRVHELHALVTNGGR